MASSEGRPASSIRAERGHHPVTPDRTPEEGYHLTEDMAGQSADWLSQQRALSPTNRSFFTSRPGATHAPIHVPRAGATGIGEHSTKAGTSCARRPSPGRRELGIIPRDCELTPRPDGIPAWSDIPDDMKPVLTRARWSSMPRFWSTPTTA